MIENYYETNEITEIQEETSLLDELTKQDEQNKANDVATLNKLPESAEAEIVEEPDQYADYEIELTDNKGEPVELAFQIKRYLLLKTKLKTTNVRNVLLDAAENFDYLTLCHVIRIFAVKEYKDDEIFEMVDRIKDKQILFYAFIYQLGENGFFDKTTIKELKDNEGTPRINVNEIVNQAMPQMISQMLRSNIIAGLNTSKN